jgi:hypothetical protein
MIKIFERKTTKGQLIEGFAVWDGIYRLQINFDGVKKSSCVPRSLMNLEDSDKLLKEDLELKEKGFSHTVGAIPIFQAEYQLWAKQKKEVIDAAILADPSNPLIKIAQIDNVLTPEQILSILPLYSESLPGLFLYDDIVDKMGNILAMVKEGVVIQERTHGQYFFWRAA